MLILALDSAALSGSVALCEDGVLIAECTVCTGHTHSETLLPMGEAVLRAAGRQVGDIGLFACTVGPGSFTGLRIGSATAKGLGLALEKPLIHVPTLDAMAYNLYGCGERICPIMDARRGQVYTGIYRFEDNTFRTLKEDCAIALEELLEELAAAQEPLVFLGDGVTVGREQIAARLGSHAR